MKKVLFITTSHNTLGDTGKQTGLWLEELTTPFYILLDNGYEVDIASVQGGDVPLDPNSYNPDGENPKSVERFIGDINAMSRLRQSVPVSEIDSARFMGVFFPGGHGTMWDLPNNPEVARIVSEIHNRQGAVGSVCHGAAGLLSATNENGESILKGRNVNSFTNEEEDSVELSDAVPFMLESKIRELGANFQKAGNFEEFAIADGNLFTGQNPASSAKVANLMLSYLNKM